ncbi:hypothetical protein [Fluviicola taffensis]|uniref:hypothetical protein n=1 Tax=Fluviicola taffensis TaxID=191579 RepID=UPI003137D407
MKQASKTIGTLFTGLVMAFGLTFSSCKKAETGPAGKNGTDGNANVQSTGEVDLNVLTWTYQGTAASDSYVSVFPTALITQEVVDKGLVMAYIKTGIGWAPLPFSGIMSGTDDITFEILNGSVKFYYRDNDELTTTPDPSSISLIVRIVIIPAQIKKPNVDHYNYQEVKAAYNL